jgi:transposase-like protein
VQENRLVRARRAAAPEDVTTTTAKVALVQELIPRGLLWVEDALQQEVAQLAGARSQREDGSPGVVRYGAQPGSIDLADQKLGIAVPRVRDLAANRESALPTHRAMRQPRGADEGVLRRILAGVSGRDYARCAEAVPEAFGLSASTVSRRVVPVSSRHLQALRARRLESDDFVAVLLDGKTFAAETRMVAVGITLSGEKIVLGLVEAGTENATVCADLLTERVDRGLRVVDGLLVVIDGGKGLPKAVENVCASAAFIPRGQGHKRENIVAYRPKAQQPSGASDAPRTRSASRKCRRWAEWRQAGSPARKGVRCVLTRGGRLRDDTRPAPDRCRWFAGEASTSETGGSHAPSRGRLRDVIPSLRDLRRGADRDGAAAGVGPEPRGDRR